MNDEEFQKMVEELKNPKQRKPPSPWDSLNKQLGYDKAFQAESNDGLIAFDFRTISAPPFASWVEDKRSFSYLDFQENNVHRNFDFGLRLKNAKLQIILEIIVFENYNYAHEVFRTHIAEVASSRSGPRMYHAWRPCEKNIGTVCARTAISSVFSYKNVVVSVETYPILAENDPLHEAIGEWTEEALIPKSPNGDPWDIAIAEWVYNILKTAPRFKEFPAEPKAKR